ncbi:CFAP157 [Symbiodinium sp. CCMP2456]|nr:CFAP157 [Symbiodinium sp. CCMP2456]
MDADPRSEEVKEHFTLRKLQERVWRLESENKELKVHNSILQTQYTSQYETNADILRTLHSNLEGNYATIERHERTIMELEHKLEDQKQQAKDDLDTEMAKKDAVIAKLKTQKEELEGQLKEVREFQRDKENMEKELASLKQQLEDNKEDFARKMSDYDRKKAVDMDILRRDMVKRVEDANEMLKAKTKEQLDSTTKRTIMENEQMFTELHFQSKETEKLMERNQSLLEENAQLRRNLLIHKDLENELARRTHLYQRLLKKMDQKLKSEAAQQEQSREFNPAKSTESAMPEQESFSLGGSREVSGSHPHSTSLSVEEISRLQRQVEDHQSTLQMVRHEFAQYRRDHATLAQLQDQSTRLIISALYELKQQKDQAPFPPTSYDPDAEWQFTNMTPKQKEYFFRVLLEKLNSSMCAMCFPVGPQATSTASLPAIGKTEQGGKEGIRFSQFLWSVATDDGPSQGLRQEMCTKACQTETSTADPCLKEGIWNPKGKTSHLNSAGMLTAGMVAGNVRNWGPKAVSHRTPKQFWTKCQRAETLGPRGTERTSSRMSPPADDRAGLKRLGPVALVGAGPGDPELLTLRAVRRLEAADVVLHDSLIPEEVLNMVPRRAQLINVGKRCGDVKDRGLQQQARCDATRTAAFQTLPSTVFVKV